MGRHSRWLHIGKRGSLVKKLNREICNQKAKADNKIEKLEVNIKQGIEEAVLYTPSNLPSDVYYMKGVLKIRHSILKEYIKEHRESLNNNFSLY